MIHVRSRLTADFTVVADALAQQYGSAVTVGVAGYLLRWRERLSSGQIRTRTYFYDVPVRGDGPPEPPRPRRQPKPEPEPAPGPEPVVARASAGPEPAPSLSDADPDALAILSGLRRVDPRLVLSAREAARLAPRVAEWLAAGVGAREVTELLTLRLPDRFRARPASILAFRLRETPLPAPPPIPLVQRAVVLPFQSCDGCARAFRAAEPGLCRDCPELPQYAQPLCAVG